MLSRLQIIFVALNTQSIGWLLFLLMGVARLTQAQCPANKPAPGNVTLTSQAQVDALAGAFPNGCTSLAGNLAINGPDITNLNGLTGLSYISGALVISNNPQLTDITGLTALTNIDYGLKISGNNLLTQLDGLNKLRSVGDNLELTSNPQLTSIDALTARTSVGNLLRLDRPLAYELYGQKITRRLHLTEPLSFAYDSTYRSLPTFG